MDKILVAFDGSDNSVRALNLGAKVAEKFGAEISLVYVANLGDIYDYDLLGKGEYDEIQESLKAEGRSVAEKLDKQGQEVLETARGCMEKSVLVAKEIVRVGRPIEEVLKVVEEEKPDMLVMGPHSKRRGGMLLGSLSKEAVERAPVSVLVAR